MTLAQDAHKFLMAIGIAAAISAGGAALVVWQSVPQLKATAETAKATADKADAKVDETNKILYEMRGEIHMETILLNQIAQTLALPLSKR